jgi:hypothetical protein
MPLLPDDAGSLTRKERRIVSGLPPILELSVKTTAFGGLWVNRKVEIVGGHSLLEVLS